MNFYNIIDLKINGTKFAIKFDYHLENNNTLKILKFNNLL